jgi:hypothetical protein
MRASRLGEDGGDEGSIPSSCATTGILTIVGKPKGSTPKKATKDRKASPEELCEQFKRTLSRRDVKVHFVGAW